MKPEFKVLIAVFGLAALFAANHFGGILWATEKMVAPLEPPKTAETQAARIVANYIDTPECNEYKSQILAAGAGSPTSGAAQYAFATLTQKASKAGCVSR